MPTRQNGSRLSHRVGISNFGDSTISHLKDDCQQLPAMDCLAAAGGS